MRLVTLQVLVLLVASFGSLAADVERKAPDGFLVVHRFEVAAPPIAVYDSLVQVGHWWHPDHTWSGTSANLGLDARAGGCFCERWADGSVQHGTVVFAKRGELLRLRAELGPLQPLAVTGVLTFAFEPDSTGTALTVSYRVSGDSLHGLDRIAPAVDRVIGAQATRLARYAETGKAE